MSQQDEDDSLSDSTDEFSDHDIVNTFAEHQSPQPVAASEVLPSTQPLQLSAFQQNLKALEELLDNVGQFRALA